MTPRQLLYDVPAERERHDIYMLQQWINEVDLYDLKVEEHERITVKLHRDVHFDDRRVWILGSVWFDAQPVLIFQEGGREGSDHQERFVVDVPAYHRLLQFLASLERDDDSPEKRDLIDIDADKPELTSFYGCTLEGLEESHPRR